MKEKTKSFKIIWRYLKNEKVSLFFYILLVLLTYLPSLLAAFFWGKAMEFLVARDIKMVLIYLVKM